MQLSVVTTLYRSQVFLERFISKMTDAVQELGIDDYEIVAVNDGSPDRSLETMFALKENDPHIVIVDLSRNFGHHYAMLAGLSVSKGDYVFTIDCDLEGDCHGGRLPPASRFLWLLRGTAGPRIYLRPIRVFVFHQVSDKFEPETMWECDWTQTDVFKRNMSSLMKKFTFLSLPEVCEHLAKDKIRLKNYAALTADDGWYSLTNILPWLTERRIPVTLFLNPSCLDGQHWNSRETDHLLTEEQVRSILEKGKPFISIASHGWTHKNSKEMTMEEFEDSVMMSEE